jgi:DNA-binding beta-propeller fold protein YncE
MMVEATATPRAGDTLLIGGRRYTFSAHPGAPRVAFGQEGRSAVVYQLVDDGGGRHALKVFRQQYRVPRIAEGAQRLRPFSTLPGMAVCERTVLTTESERGLLEAHPELLFAVQMPWADGRTWHDLLLSREPLDAPQSLRLATALVEVLAGLEERGLAHCDLSGPNVVFDIPTGSATLVDVEDLYGPSAPRPEQLPAGSDGYAHCTGPAGVWGPEADRFAAAVLLAEILGWSNERVRRHAVGERYFARDELQRDSDRLVVLVQALASDWSGDIASAFQRAWRSASLVQCPALAEWRELVHAVRPAPGGANYRSAALREELELVANAGNNNGDQLAAWHCPNPACGREVLPGWTTCPACQQELDAPAPAARSAPPRRRLPSIRTLLAGAVAGALVMFTVLALVPQFSTPTPPMGPAPGWTTVGDSRPVAFGEPVGVAFDPQGRMYVSQNGLHSITVLAADGDSVLATWGGLGSAPGKLDNPAGLAIDGEGVLYVADSGNNRIQKFGQDGSALGQLGGAGSGPGQLSDPRGVAFDRHGNLYVADSGNHRIQKFASDGRALASFGSFGTGPDNYYFPYAVAVDSRGNIYAADRNNNRLVVRAPDGRPLDTWPTTGAGPDVGNPSALAIDGADNVYVGGWQGNRLQRIQKRSPDGTVQATWPINSDSPAQISLTMGLAFDAQGALFVTEVGADRVRKLSAEGQTVETFGQPRTGPGQFKRPNNVAVDRQDNLYAVDWANERVSVFDARGQFKAQWGPFRDLQGVATDADGSVYVTERSDCRVRKLSPAGQTLATWGGCGSDKGQLKGPEALAVDAQGNVLVADRGNNRVARFAPTGEPEEPWGAAGQGEGKFDDPSGIAVDSAGNVYVADRNNRRIVKLTATGQYAGALDQGQLEAPEAVTTDTSGNVYVADWGASQVLRLSPSGSVDELGGAGPGAGQFDAPEGIVVDSHGNVYVADTGNNRVQRLTH